jgi:hypothetical protein
VRVAPGIEPRGYDYTTSVNIGITPRKEEPITFAQMRALSQNCAVLATVIQTRKDQLTKMKWQVKLKKLEGETGKAYTERAKNDPRLKELTEFFRKPDRETDWASWLSALLDDLLVIDAPTIYPRRTKGGKLYSLNLIDGGTIKRIIDNNAMTPMPPEAAYQQILKGVPARNLTTDDIIYRPRNKRTYKMYGYSPVEQIILIVNIALRRDIYAAEYYTEGTLPDTMLRVPETWTPNQIEEFTVAWNLMNETTADRRKVKFVPNFEPIIAKPNALKDVYDEWVARIICYCFGVPCSPFIKETNRATAETQKEQSMEEGLLPYQSWLTALIDDIIQSKQFFGYDDIEFGFQDDREEDSLKQAQIDEIHVKSGLRGIDEVRQRDGLDAVGIPVGFITMNGFVPADVAIEQAATSLDAAKAGAEAAKNPPEPGAPPKPGKKTGMDAEKISVTKKKLY